MHKQNRVFLIFSALVLITLTCIVFQPYFSLDEPNILWSLRSGKGWNGYFYSFVADGRPIYGMFQLAGIELAGTLGNLKFLRIISILFTFLFCLLLFHYLKKKGVQPTIAFIMATMIFCLPGFSVFMAWGQQYSHHFSSLLSFFAGILTVAVFDKMLGEKSLSKSRENVYIITAVILQIVSLFIYQSMSLAFVLPAFYTLLLKQDALPKAKIRFFYSVVLIFFISLILYYKLFQSVLHSSGVGMTARGSREGYDLFDKVHWFTIHILKEASKLHLLLMKSSFFASLFSFVLIGILVRDLIKKRFLDILFLFAFSVLLFLPHLFITVSWGASRNFALISSIFSVYMVLRIFELLPTPNQFVSILVSSVFAGLLFINIGEGWVKPMKKDYAYLSKYAAHLPAITTDTLYVRYVPPRTWSFHENNSFLRLYSDEFNAPEFIFLWPVAPSLKCLYQDSHPGISMETINTFMKIDTLNAPSMMGKPSVVLDFNYDYVPACELGVSK
jgi:hypothetical protein